MKKENQLIYIQSTSTPNQENEQSYKPQRRSEDGRNASARRVCNI
jgi:hypothetical protein